MSEGAGRQSGQSPDDSATRSARGAAARHPLGPFVTRVAAVLSDGRHLVATSRRHRKGLAPHACAAHEVARIRVTRRDVEKIQ